jgi:hypothetical protein
MRRHVKENRQTFFPRSPWFGYGTAHPRSTGRWVCRGLRPKTAPVRLGGSRARQQRRSGKIGGPEGPCCFQGASRNKPLKGILVWVTARRVLTLPKGGLIVKKQRFIQGRRHLGKSPLRNDWQWSQKSGDTAVFIRRMYLRPPPNCVNVMNKRIRKEIA